MVTGDDEIEERMSLLDDSPIQSPDTGQRAWGFFVGKKQKKPPEFTDGSVDVGFKWLCYVLRRRQP